MPREQPAAMTVHGQAAKPEFRMDYYVALATEDPF